jgi:hypothetical protein
MGGGPGTGRPFLWWARFCCEEDGASFLEKRSKKLLGIKGVAEAGAPAGCETRGVSTSLQPYERAMARCVTKAGRSIPHRRTGITIMAKGGVNEWLVHCSK